MFEYLGDLAHVTVRVIELLEELGPYRFRLVGSEECTDGKGVLVALPPEGSEDVVASVSADGARS